MPPRKGKKKPAIAASKSAADSEENSSEVSPIWKYISLPDYPKESTPSILATGVATHVALPKMLPKALPDIASAAAGIKGEGGRYCESLSPAEYEEQYQRIAFDEKGKPTEVNELVEKIMRFKAEKDASSAMIDDLLFQLEAEKTAHAAESVKAQRAYLDLEVGLNEIAKECQDQKRQIEAMTVQRGDLVLSISQFQARVKDLDTEITEVKAENTVLELEKSDLEERISSLNSAALKKLQDKNRALVERNKELEGKLTTLSEVEERRAVLEAEALVLRRQITSFEMHKIEASSADLKELSTEKRKVDNLAKFHEEECIRLTAELEKAKVEIEFLQRRLATESHGAKTAEDLLVLRSDAVPFALAELSKQIADLRHDLAEKSKGESSSAKPVYSKLPST